MAAQKTITINGRQYDAVTGLPISQGRASAPTKATSARPTTPGRPAVASPTKAATQSAPKPPAKTASASKVAASGAKVTSPKPKPTPAASRSQTASNAVHGNVQKSQTLMRRATKKPVAPPKIARRTQPGRHMDIARNTNVTKFAPHPVVKEAPAPKKSVAPLTPDTPARVHPAAQRALAKAHSKKEAKLKAAKPVTSKEVKEAAISKALSTPKAKAKKAPKNKWVKRGAIIGSSVILLLVLLFAVYKFIPSVSVSIAATQAGIEARYPDYTPDGYSLSQPVTFSDGEVNLEFKSNSNETAYAINQKRSSWDSSAVLDNVVLPKVGENYTTTKERGLTIYSYDKGAAWVNGGILYTISGDAPLSGDQIRRLATSL